MIDWQGRAIFATDEIFYLGRHPILVTVDPLSGAILRMDVLDRLSKEAWQAHWQALRLTSDEAWVMQAAREETFEAISWQPDTFHGLS